MKTNNIKIGDFIVITARPGTTDSSWFGEPLEVHSLQSHFASVSEVRRKLNVFPIDLDKIEFEHCTKEYLASFLKP